MEIINESDIRSLLLANPSPQEFVERVRTRLLDPSLSWEEKRPYWHFLFYCGHNQDVVEMLKAGLAEKQRIPFDLLIELCARVNLKPEASILESLLKGFRKQKAYDDILASRGWDKWDPRLEQLRLEVLEKKTEEHKHYKENLKEKFLFLRNQRMNREALPVLRRMRKSYPEDQEFQRLGREFDEELAREVLAAHMAHRPLRESGFRDKPSHNDEEMVKCLFSEGYKLAVEKPEVAYDLAISFWFLEEFDRALEIVKLAPVTRLADWLKAELLFASRRFIEALEHLNSLETKYVNDPETTFSVSYLRAQCLYALGQTTSGLEMMQSIAQIRSHYRSAHALILEWTQGAPWE